MKNKNWISIVSAALLVGATLVVLRNVQPETHRANSVEQGLRCENSALHGQVQDLVVRWNDALKLVPPNEAGGAGSGPGTDLERFHQETAFPVHLRSGQGDFVEVKDACGPAADVFVKAIPTTEHPVEELQEGKVVAHWPAPYNNVPTGLVDDTLIVETAVASMCADCTKPRACSGARVSLWIKPSGAFEVRDVLKPEEAGQAQPVPCPGDSPTQSVQKGPKNHSEGLAGFACIKAVDLKSGRVRLLRFPSPCG